MIRIVLDDVLREKLQGTTQPVELCDANGKALALVTPIPPLPFYVGMESPLSPEEIARRIKNPRKTYTGEEIDRMLESR